MEVYTGILSCNSHW